MSGYEPRTSETVQKFNDESSSSSDMPRNMKRFKELRKPMCPIEYGVLPELHELVFQHFDPADVLIVSETSKTWWTVIGESKKCMKQIRLGLENWESTETCEDMVRIMEIIKSSKRRYQNIRINSNDDEAVSEKSVQLLKYFSPSLVDVRFLNADGVEIRQKFKFPKLESLQFINNVSDVDDLFLFGCTELKELNLKHHYWADPEPVRACLKKNPNLKMLKLWDTGIPKLFTVHEPGYQFQLKRFATGADGEMTSEIEENFIKFLESQSKSIEAIRFRSGLDGATAAIINKIFEMNTMKIIHLDGISESICQVPVNPKIIELRLPWSIDTLEKLKPFLRAVPKAKVLFLRKINMEILAFIAMQMKHLMLLYYTRAEGCMGCFKKFIASEQDANKDINLVNKEWY